MDQQIGLLNLQFPLVMSKNTIEEYIICYQQLTQPQFSKQANQKLLEIQNSFEAWTIAYHLLSNHNNNQEVSIHGAQLLSKKLNIPPPQEVDLTVFLTFLYNIPQKTSLNWLCIAKIIIHLSPQQPVIPETLSSFQRLKLLKEIPAAITHIRTQQQIDGVSLKQKYISMATPLILSQFQQKTGLIVEVLDSFVSYGAKIKNSQIVRALISFPFQVVGHILEEILGREKYPELQNELISYLETKRNQPRIFEIYVSFLKTVNFSQLTYQQISSSLDCIITCLLNQKEQPKNKLSDSYELWVEISKQYLQKQLSAQVKLIFRQAFLAVWKITCKQALLRQLPQKLQKHINPLELTANVDAQEEMETNYQMDKQLQNFRQYAGDFFILCYQTLSLEPNSLATLIGFIEQLASGPLIHLELAIRIIFSLAPAKNNLLIHAARAIAHILGRGAQMNEYVCKEVIRMIGQLSDVFIEVPDLLAPALLFVSNSFSYPVLGTMASASSCTLLEQMNLEKASGLVAIMQVFMQHMYEIIFKPECQQKVIDLLSKSMAIFVYKVKHSPEDYFNYLSVYKQRILLQPKQDQPKFIDAAISGQFWINSRQELKKSQAQQNQTTFNNFMPPFSAFLQDLVPTIIELLNVSERKVFFKRLLLISSALRTNCIGNGEIWLQACDYLLQNYLKKVRPVEINKIISPLLNLTRAASQLKIKNVAITVCKGLKKWHNQITSLLDINLQQIDLTFSSSIVYFHVRVAQLIKDFPECANLIAYHPQPTLDYIFWALSKSQIWEYQLFKYCLQYFLVILQLGYAPQNILTCIFKNFDRLQQTLWTSLDPILSFIFKSYGFQIYQKVLANLQSQLADRMNPLNGVLREAFQNGEAKSVKNLLMSL